MATSGTSATTATNTSSAAAGTAPRVRSNSLAGTCPAFDNGCPYKPADASTTDANPAATSPTRRDSVGSAGSSTSFGSDLSGVDLTHLKDKCPAFKEHDGCPFKGIDPSDVSTLAEKLAEAPSNHAPLTHVLGHVHSVSVAKRRDLGGRSCPVFETACPFKTVTSNGVTLVDEVQSASWAQQILLIEAEMQADAKAAASAASAGAAGATAAADESKAAEATPPPPLSKHLKTGTRKAHRDAENVTFVRSFMKGKVSIESYKTFHKNLYWVYAAMERLLDEAAAKADAAEAGGDAAAAEAAARVKAVHYPEQLRRANVLQRDLVEHWFKDELAAAGGGGDDDMAAQLARVAAPTQAAAEYASRLEAAAAADPTLLIAHAYTRYLGDLSGGQVLARCLKRHYGPLGDRGEGGLFYDFADSIPEGAKVFKTKYRAALDALELPMSVADAVVVEANAAFVLNTRLFQELDVMAGVEGVVVTPLPPAVGATSADGGADEADDGSAKCPFAKHAKAMGMPNPHASHAGGGASAGAGAAGAAATAGGIRTVAEAEHAGKCPFPFVLLHDPKQALHDPVAWASLAVALLACAMYYLLSSVGAGGSA